MSEDQREWVPIACIVADAIRSNPEIIPYGGRSDLGGTYGEPCVYTEWGWKGPTDRPVMREWRYPDERAVDHPGEDFPDVKPCRHDVLKDTRHDG